MVYRFGDCCLDDSARQLVRAGQERHLSRKAYDLLRLLLYARPRVVTKSEVMDALWPDTFVSEANIAVLVGELRAAVGDSSRTSTVIRTRSGVGYSFVADVIEAVRQAGGAPGQIPPVLLIGARRLLLPDGVSTVGRDETCDVRLSHPSVSRLHARIFIGDGAAYVEDAGSKNGVWVEGRQVNERTLLVSGASVRFGAVEASLRFGDDVAGSTWSIA